MRTRLTAVLAVVAALATVATLPAREPSQQDIPVFRGGTNLIRVDMYATEGGRLVPDLRPEDVELYEDGVRQTIQTFELVNVAGGESAGSDVAGREDSRTRIYVMFVDTNTTRLDGDTELRSSLLRFLDRTVQPNDLVGLMTPEMSALDVTLRRRAAVMSDLANDERWVQAPVLKDPKTFAWENCYATGRRVSRRVTEMTARRDAKATIDALRDLVDHLRGLREERKAVLLVTSGWPYSDNTSALATGSDNETKTCEDDRKALLRTDYDGHLRELARTANRANVSFYPVSARRPVVVPSQMPAALRNDLRRREMRTRDHIASQLEDLAMTTDGAFELDVKGIDRVADRIVADTSSYYLIGYESTNQRQDSRYRAITMKVNRPRVTVRSRSGYGGENVRVVRLAADPARPLMDSRVSTALGVVQRFDAETPLFARASTFSRSTEGVTGGAIWITGELGAQARRAGGGTAEVIVTDSDRAELLARRVDLSALPAFEVRVPESGMLPLGRYSVKVRFLPPNDGPPVINDLARVELAAERAGLGEPVLWRRTSAARGDYQQTADPRFRRTELLRLELATDAAEPLTARVLDRLGQPLPLPVHMTERPAEAGTRWVVADVALAGLAPGDYTVAITQAARTQFAAFRLIP